LDYLLEIFRNLENLHFGLGDYPLSISLGEKLAVANENLVG
jgi:hypothetical protein